jgi:hypothetical protein
MAPKSGAGKYGGILVRAANGDLYFTRSDHKAPQKLDSVKLRNRVELFAQDYPQEFVNHLPKDIMSILEGIFGPLWGVIFCNAPRLRH